MAGRLGVRSRGTTLVEALITFLVLSLGLLAVSRVQGQLRLAGDTGRQRSEAVRLAQEDIEQLRGFVQIVAKPGVPGRAYADIVSSQRLIGATSGQPGNTAYRLTREVAPSTVSSARTVSVRVDWIDRAGRPQTVGLETILAANDPALSGALGLAPAIASVNGPLARAVQIPTSARNLGDGRSAFQPESAGGLNGAVVTFLLDNASGVVTARCESAGAAGAPVAAGAAGSGVPPAGLGVCTSLNAYLLTGVIRFATGASVALIEPVRRASVALQLSGGSQTQPPSCVGTPVTTADGDRYLDYACIVSPPSSGRWSGETRLVPDGWTFAGAGASGLHICREGGLDTGAVGRLASYANVSGTLAQQNFRVVRGDLACPV